MKAEYTYRYAQVAGKDVWRWQQANTLLTGAAPTEKEAIRRICETAKARGVEPVIRDISVVRPANERKQQSQGVGIST